MGEGPYITLFLPSDVKGWGMGKKGSYKTLFYRVTSLRFTEFVKNIFDNNFGARECVNRENLKVI